MLLDRVLRPRALVRATETPAVGWAPLAVAALFALALLALTLAPATAGSWKGHEVEKEGVVHVMNPAEGMDPPTEVDLDELWRLGGDTEDEEEFFGVITRIVTDPRGNIYVLDMQLSEVKIYSADGEYLNTIGREGEGPGEFRRPGDMFFVPEGNLGVMQAVPGKIVLLTPEGDPAGNFPLPAPEGGGFQVLLRGQLAANHLVLGRQLQVFAEGKVSQTISIDRLDVEGNLKGTYITKERVLELANLVIDEKSFDTFEHLGRWDVAKDGRVYACASHLDYEIRVYNPDCSLDRVIQRKYEHRERSQEEKDRMYNLYEAFTRQAPNAKIEISDYNKDITSIHPRDDGSLWVLTSRGTQDIPEGVLGVFDVFDTEGRYVREVTLRGQGDPENDGYFFVGNRLYIVTGWLDAVIALQGGAEREEEEEEPVPMELICYRVDEPVIAKGQ